MFGRAPNMSPSAPTQGLYGGSGGTPSLGGKGGATGTATAQPPNIMQTSANLFNQAAAGPNISQFANPFQQQVIDNTMADMNRSRGMALGQIGQQASAAGAFGGSRHGVAEAETNRGFFDQAGNMAANLNMQGFNTALNAAQQNQQMQAGLSQQGFNMGNTLNQQQMQQGAMQQALQQQLIDAAKGQYAGFTGAPMNSLQAMMAAVGGANMGQQTQTQSKQPGLFDFLTLGATMLCWVAREVYGEEDTRWTEFRHWLLTAAPKWLLNAYVKHGEAFAGVVRKVPLLKRVLRPLMDRARRSAGFVG